MTVHTFLTQRLMIQCNSTCLEFATKFQIWRCAFEPNPDNADKWTGIVATCGGSYICLIDAHKGECKAKLLQHEDQYFDILWTTHRFADGKNTNVLSAAGR